MRHAEPCTCGPATLARDALWLNTPRDMSAEELFKVGFSSALVIAGQHPEWAAAAPRELNLKHEDWANEVVAMFPFQMAAVEDFGRLNEIGDVENRDERYGATR